jgi:hypothetical protein
VDPRDIEVEWDATTYRVYVWSEDGGRCTEFELTGVQHLQQVLSWAEANADDCVPEIFVRHDHGSERGAHPPRRARPGVEQVPIPSLGTGPPRAETFPRERACGEVAG